MYTFPMLCVLYRVKVALPVRKETLLFYEHLLIQVLNDKVVSILILIALGCFVCFHWGLKNCISMSNLKGKWSQHPALSSEVLKFADPYKQLLNTYKSLRNAALFVNIISFHTILIYVNLWPM